MTKNKLTIPKDISEKLLHIVVYTFSKYRGITSLQLQRVIYNTQLKWIYKHKKLLFNDEIKMLEFGNVITILYEKFHLYFFLYSDQYDDFDISLSNELIEIIDNEIKLVKQLDNFGYEINLLGNRDEFYEEKLKLKSTLENGENESWRIIDLLKK